MNRPDEPLDPDESDERDEPESDEPDDPEEPEDPPPEEEGGGDEDDSLLGPTGTKNRSSAAAFALPAMSNRASETLCAAHLGAGGKASVVVGVVFMRAGAV